MITTNKTQPKPKKEDLKLRVLTTNTIKPKEFDFQPREYEGFIKKETRKPGKGLLTQINLEKRQRNARRLELMRKRKRLMAEMRAQEQASLAEDPASHLVDEIKTPERPEAEVLAKDSETIKEKPKKSSSRKKKEEDEG